MTTAMALMVGAGRAAGRGPARRGGSIATISTPAYPPVPPHALPPARTVIVPDRGEFFLRDSGGEGPPVMLLHGWVVNADLNWHAAYEPLIEAGYRVLAIDHRGHGRGLRALTPFRLTDCAADAVAVVRELGLAPATFVGYSMGGTIAQLIARDHREAVSAIVLSGTAQHFQDPETVKTLRWMGALKLGLSAAPRGLWRAGFRQAKISYTPRTAWWMSELTRHAARDIAEAGRELGRFDSRPWLGAISVPAATVITSKDRSVSPDKQYELARAIGATVFEVAIDHLEVTARADEYNAQLLRALEAVRSPEPVTVA